MPHDGWHPHDHPHPLRRMVLAAASFLPFGGTSAQAADAAQRIAEAAQRFLGGLDEAQRRQAMIAFESGNRLDWHYIPRDRQGLPFSIMSRQQQDLAHALFATVLNERGVQTIDSIRTILEDLLRQQQGGRHDPGLYYVSIFGTPGRFPWGWRLEGHHLSLNVTLPSAGEVRATPFFLGAQPETVHGGPHRGLRVLGPAEDLARQLMASLDDAQRRTAVIAERAFDDIVAGPGREHELARPSGLPLAEMGEPARHLVEALVDHFVGTLAPDLAAIQRRRVIEQELARFHFSWAGALERGQPHYFRVHGPITLIEYDNTQDHADHVHSVWHDLEADFGNDALAEHYRRQPHR